MATAGWKTSFSARKPQGIFVGQARGAAGPRRPETPFGKGFEDPFSMILVQAEPTEGYIAKGAPFWSFLNIERVCRQGTQNQLCERSIETDVFCRMPSKPTKPAPFFAENGRHWHVAAAAGGRGRPRACRKSIERPWALKFELATAGWKTSFSARKPQRYFHIEGNV